MRTGSTTFLANAAGPGTGGLTSTVATGNFSVGDYLVGFVPGPNAMRAISKAIAVCEA